MVRTEQFLALLKDTAEHGLCLAVAPLLLPQRCQARHRNQRVQIFFPKQARAGFHGTREMFLGFRIEKTKLPGKKRPSITRTLRSTKELKVKAMSDYLDKVMAHAATTFCVAFPAGVTWESYREGGR